ncbi:hypothetical protein OE88DRAFT_1606907, partial [Heliocybe sulcata]
LRAYELSDEEWDVLQQLCDVLKDATLFFSRATPNLATVIPAMDHIDNFFTDVIRDKSKYGAPLRAAIAIGKKTLNRYYNLTDSSELYRIAMVLHPRHKLSYFKRAGWQQDWIDTAESIVREEY